MGKFKFSSGKISVWVLLTAVLLGAFLIGKSLTSVSATTDGWGTCTSSGPQCGTDNGNQSRTVYTDFNTSCPAGYVSNSSDDFNKKCKKDTVTTADPIFTCPTHYHLQNHGNWNERCHRDDNADHDLAEHTNPTASCPPGGYVQGGSELATTCTKTATVYSAPTVTCPGGYTQSGSGASTVCSKVLTQPCHTGVTQYDSCTPAGTCPTTCGYEGGTVPDGHGGQTQCSATRACETQPTPTPTPAPFDACPNLPGIQTSIPDGYHVDQPGGTCNTFQYGGPPQNNGGTGGTVLGTSTQGQVLGASTMAGTGTFEENLYMAIMGIGGTLTAFGLKNFKKAFKKA